MNNYSITRVDGRRLVTETHNSPVTKFARILRPLSPAATLQPLKDAGAREVHQALQVFVNLVEPDYQALEENGVKEFTRLVCFQDLTQCGSAESCRGPVVGGAWHEAYKKAAAEYEELEDSAPVRPVGECERLLCLNYVLTMLFGNGGCLESERSFHRKVREAVSEVKTSGYRFVRGPWGVLEPSRGFFAYTQAKKVSVKRELNK